MKHFQIRGQIMPVQFQRISDQGANNPIVARLGMQTIELLRWSGLEDQKNERIGGLYIRTLTQRLVRCEQTTSKIQRALAEDIERVENNIRKGYSLEVPYVVGLEGFVEDFLYEAKNYLRDLLGFFHIGYGCLLVDASAFVDTKGKNEGKLVQWAITEFGKGDQLVSLLQSDQDWISELIWKRNAVEHPGEKSGALIISNVQIHASGEGLVPPCWHRTSFLASDMLSDMANLVTNLLMLAEDLLADLVKRTCSFKQVEIYEIPDSRRNVDCPIRLCINLNEELLKSPDKASSKSPKQKN